MKNEKAIDKNNWPPYLKRIYDNPGSNKIENDPFETEKEDNPLDSFLNKATSNPINESKEKNPRNEEDTPFCLLF